MAKAADKTNIDPRGGHNRKSVEDHIVAGTYRRDRHGPRPGCLTIEPKPPAIIQATVASQSRWIKSGADRHAVNNGCRFNEALAEHVCNFFVDHLRHSKGEWAGQPFELMDWQREKLIYPLFGWVRPDGARRFRRSYIEWPKKNGKSTVAAGIGLYMLVADEEAGAEIYSMGADKDQAKVVHREAVNMVDASEGLASVAKVNRTNGLIYFEKTKSWYKALSGSGRGKAGLNIHCGIIDELHEWFGHKAWDAVKFGHRARRQPLFFTITNAGDDITSVCAKQQEKAQAIMDGKMYDDSFFPQICAATREEAEAEVQAVANGSERLPVAASCNLGLGTLIKEDALLADIKDAVQTPSELPNLLRLTYGIWALAADPWLNKPHWDACRHDFTEADLIGQTCYAGMDLSKTSDMTSVVLVFPQEEDTYKVLPYFWLPQERIDKEKVVVEYAQWAKLGFIRPIPGPVIENSYIEDFLANEAANKFDLQGVAYDPMYASDLTARLEDDHGILRVKFAQTIMVFANPTAEFERLVIAGQLHHPGNPVFDWQAGHVTVKVDVNNNKRPIKPPASAPKKIDGIVAGIMGLFLAMAAPETSVYDNPDYEMVAI